MARVTPRKIVPLARQAPSADLPCARGVLGQSPDIVYLDEPTSGLDASSTLELVQCLRHVASTGRIVIASIHQPRVEVFDLFSQIYILL